MNPVYITSVGAFLPNAPVDNAHIEQVLGQVRGAPSRLRERVLEQNGIRSRHYALDECGRTTHLNEELAALAIKELFWHAAVCEYAHTRLEQLHRERRVENVERLAATIGMTK